jgi:hypothetical protein
MFERDRSYPTAVTGDDFEDAELDAIAWAAEQQKTVGGTILLYVPTKASLQDGDGPLARLAKLPGVVVATPKTGIYGWSGGPVIAAWPTRESLAQLADQHRLKALCVIPGGPEETSAWQQAANPELLGTAEAPAAAEALDPVVAVGLKHLTHMVNHANNLAGALDHRDAVAVLRELHRGGYRLPADAVYAYALAHGWPGRGAERLRELASKIDAGRTVRLQSSSPLRPDILQRWRDEAAA